MTPRQLSVGILLTVLAGLVFSAMDGLSKHLTGALPVLQIVWARYASQTVLMALFLGATTGTAFLRTRRPVLQLLRGATLLVTTLLMYAALSRVPLADATAVLFFSPMMVTLLSVAFLGERIGPPRILAVAAGFGGVLLVLRPGLGSMHPALLLVVAAAVTNAAFLLMTRALAGRDDAASTQFNTTAAGAVILTALVLPGWTTPPTANWLPMVLIGVAGTVGHFLLVMAFSRAPASLLSPFLYSQVAGAALISVFVFGDPLHPATLAGALVLVASGVAIWWRENRGRVAELAAGRGGPQPPHGK